MTTGGALRVAVEVSPRLFNDALTRVLEHHNVEVVRLPPSGAPVLDRLDVVVTSPGGGEQIPDDVLVVEVEPGAASSVVEQSHRDAASCPHVRSLEDLMAVIRRFAGPPDRTAA